MRKALTTVVVIVLFTGLFAGSWFLTGALRGGEEVTLSTTPAVPGATVTNGAETEDVSDPGAASSVVFAKPENPRQLWFGAGSALTKLNANHIVRARAIMYATIAIYELVEPAGGPGILPGIEGGQGIEQGILAGGYVMSEIVGNAALREAITAWDGEMTPETRAIADLIIARAKTDGFDDAGDAKAPAFDGPLGWVPGSTRNGLSGGLEPGFGSVTPILFDIAACPVAPAPLTRIGQERAALGEMPDDVKTPPQASPELIGGVGAAYINVTALPDATLEEFHVGMHLYILVYDAMIATWKAQWANGVASPLDVSVGDRNELRLSHPSYPSWNAVALSALETFVNDLYGSDLTAEEIDEKAKSSRLQDTDDIDSSFSVTGLLRETLTGTVYNWDADIDAGRELGSCLAKQAVARVRR